MREPGMRHVGTIALELPQGWSQGLASADDYELQVGIHGFTLGSAALSSSPPRSLIQHVALQHTRCDCSAADCTGRVRTVDWPVSQWVPYV